MDKPIFCIIGASATGKTTLLENITEHNEDIGVIVSHTTRQKRSGEIDGKDYYYISNKEFDKLNKIEEVTYAGNRYAISREEVDRKLNDNSYSCLVVIVDYNGFKQLKNLYGDLVHSIYIYAPYRTVIKRLISRDGFLKGMKRFIHAITNGEFRDYREFDLYVYNDYYTPEECAKGLLKEINNIFVRDFC